MKKMNDCLAHFFGYYCSHDFVHKILSICIRRWWVVNYAKMGCVGRGGLNNAFIDKRMIGEEEKQWDVNELKLLGIGSTRSYRK